MWSKSADDHLMKVVNLTGFTVLRWYLRKVNWREWIGLIGLRIGTDERHL